MTNNNKIRRLIFLERLDMLWCPGNVLIEPPELSNEIFTAALSVTEAQSG